MPDDGNRGPDVSLHGVGSGEHRARSNGDSAITLNEGTKFILRGSGIVAAAVFLLWLGGEWKDFNRVRLDQVDLNRRVVLLESSMARIESGMKESSEKQTTILSKQEMGNVLLNELRVALAGKGIIITQGGN
jgi:hypothetical protein